MMWRAPTPQRLMVYRLRLPPEQQQRDILAATENLLTAADRARLQKFRVPGAAAEFYFGRLLLRSALSALLPPERREVIIDPFGKPQLVGDDFCFNLSHSGGTILLALATEPVGIDSQLQMRIGVLNIDAHWLSGQGQENGSTAVAKIKAEII
ncbi:MAG: hypothetical protein AAFW95_11160, partial [Cyanobacteria bacterium J06638_6]